MAIDGDGLPVINAFSSRETAEVHLFPRVPRFALGIDLPQLLGDKLSARNFQSQVNEIHARMAVLNKFTDLGRPHTRVVT